MWLFNRNPIVAPASGARRPDAIVDSRLHVKLDLDHSLKGNSLFLTDLAAQAELASQLLLYDTVVIPTNDFGIVPILISWLGLHAFEDALDRGALQFLRRKGLLAYVGNGNGISEISIAATPQHPFEWWQAALFGEDIRESIATQLRHMCAFVDSRARAPLVARIEGATRLVNFDNQFFITSIANASYEDTRDTPELREWVRRRIPQGRPIDLVRLPDVDANQTRVLSSGPPNDSVDLVLKVAELNTELVLGNLAGGADVHVSDGVQDILRHKLSRAGATGLLDGFLKLLEITGVPDIRPAIATDAIALTALWSLRNKRHARRFRTWLRAADVGNERDLVRLYVEALGRSSLVQALPMRVIRFALTTVVGIVQPVAGVAVGVADSFFVDRLFAGYTPKLLVDDMRRIIPPAMNP